MDLASPAEVEKVEGCNKSVVTVAAEQIEGNPCIVETVSDCATGEAGSDGIVTEGGERKITTGSSWWLQIKEVEFHIG